MLAVSAAAAVVLIGGVVAALSGHAPGSAGTNRGPALISITGCPALAQVNGTLEQRSGGDLVIKTASVTVSVSTTAATRLAVSRAPPGDITDGASVVVAGPRSGGTIAAARVAVGGKASLTALPGTVVTQGTVADARPGGFTVVTSTGVRVPVTTSSATSVTVLPPPWASCRPRHHHHRGRPSRTGRNAVGGRGLPAPGHPARSVRERDPR